MNFRLMLLTSGLLTGTVLGSGCTREELAPWFPQGLDIECRDVPPATLGQSYTFDLMVTGGVDPLTIEVTGLPAGLTVNADGVISGTPTEEGSFDFQVKVTDGDGNVREFSDCGDLVVAPPDQPTIQCIDDSGSIPDGFVGLPYPEFVVNAPGGVTPYEWSVTGLPPGLTLVPGAASGTSATISGTATEVGTFNVEITVTDASGVVTVAECGELIISNPISLDPDKLLEAYPDGCVPLGETLNDLLKAGILFGGDGTEISCDFVPGRGNGNKKWDGTNDTQPPGLVLDADTCAWGGTVSPNLPFGIYAYITTFTQSGQKAFVPHCAPQEVQAPTAYDVLREDTGTDSTFKAGHLFVDPFDAANPDKKWTFGSDVPDPKITVTDDAGACAGNTCFYSFVFAYNALSSMASVSANPNSKFPAMGFDGFTHAVRVSDVSLELFRNRPYVANIQFDYCIADNSDDCGNGDMVKKYTSEERAALVKMNGGGSNYYFSLVLLPAN